MLSKRRFFTRYFIHNIAITTTSTMPRFMKDDYRHTKHPDHQRYLDGEFDTDGEENEGETLANNGKFVGNSQRVELRKRGVVSACTGTPAHHHHWELFIFRDCFIIFEGQQLSFLLS
jgi:hypothetical protein